MIGKKVVFSSIQSTDQQLWPHHIDEAPDTPAERHFILFSSYSWIVFPLPRCWPKKNCRGCDSGKIIFPFLLLLKREEAGLGVPIVSVSNEWGETYYYTAHSMVLLASVCYILLFCFFFLPGGKNRVKWNKESPPSRKERTLGFSNDSR